MNVRRVLVLESQTPFAHGDAGSPVPGLVAALRARGYETERIAIPFRGAPLDELVAHAAVWRLLDLSRAGAQQVDLVIATEFPTYFVRHPAKVAWLVPGHRTADEWSAAALGDGPPTAHDASVRERLIAMDAAMLAECAARFTSGRATAPPMDTPNGLVAAPLYPPHDPAEAAVRQADACLPMSHARAGHHDTSTVAWDVVVQRLVDATDDDAAARVGH